MKYRKMFSIVCNAGIYARSTNWQEICELFKAARIAYPEAIIRTQYA